MLTITQAHCSIILYWYAPPHLSEHLMSTAFAFPTLQLVPIHQRHFDHKPRWQLPPFASHLFLLLPFKKRFFSQQKTLSPKIQLSWPSTCRVKLTLLCSVDRAQRTTQRKLEGRDDLKRLFSSREFRTLSSLYIASDSSALYCRCDVLASPHPSLSKSLRFSNAWLHSQVPPDYLTHLYFLISHISIVYHYIIAET